MTSQALPEKTSLQARLREVPHKPGVYLMRDRFGRVIYVGKARDLRKRLGSYFMPSRRTRADPKTRALIESIHAFEAHTVRSEPEALMLEGRLIKEFRPKYNISFRDDKRFLLVKVDEREEWPRFRLARFKKEDGARYFGPFVHSSALRHTLDLLRRKYGILTFGRGSPTPKELKYSCYQVPSRLSDLSPEQYRERVVRAAALLDGGEASQELIASLQTEMETAAGKLDFEKAAQLRDMISALRETTRRTRKFSRASLPSTVDPVRDLQVLADALDLPSLPVRMECFDISNISTTHVVASMVTFRDGSPDRSGYRRFRIAGVSGQDDFASIAEVVRRRYTRVLNTPANEQFAGRLPDLVIVDGGRGQLSAACRELGALEISSLPVIGLAKEFEEIYRPGKTRPLRLPPDSGALRLLQRIRDEAHRFANGYHQLLMKRRISESLLDDCPGVSENRKQQLLRTFGSVTRLRRATAEEIASVTGIGPKLATTLHHFLQSRPV